MGKGKHRARPAATDDSDDALLQAAIAENAAVLEKAALESQRVQAEQRAAQAAREAACAQRDEEGAPLSREAICSLMDVIPTFCIVDAQKQFVQLTVQGATGAAADCCVAWTEPLEAQQHGPRNGRLGSAPAWRLQRLGARLAALAVSALRVRG